MQCQLHAAAMTCVVWQVFLGRCNVHTYSPKIGTPKQFKYRYHPNPLLWTMSCIESVSEGLLKGAAMTQRQLLHQSPPLHGCQSRKARNLELTAQPLGSSSCQRVSFPSNSVVPNFFQVAWLFSASSGQLVWSQSLLCRWALRFWEGLAAFIAYSGMEKPSESGWFLGLPEANHGGSRVPTTMYLRRGKQRLLSSQFRKLKSRVACIGSTVESEKQHIQGALISSKCHDTSHRVGNEKSLSFFLRAHPRDSYGDERTSHKDISSRLRCLLGVHLWGLSCTQSNRETRISLVTIDPSVHTSLLQNEALEIPACVHPHTTIHVWTQHYHHNPLPSSVFIQVLTLVPHSSIPA